MIPYGIDELMDGGAERERSVSSASAPRRYESFLQNVDFAVTSSLAVAFSLFEKALERMKFLPGSL